MKLAGELRRMVLLGKGEDLGLKWGASKARLGLPRGKKSTYGRKKSLKRKA